MASSTLTSWLSTNNPLRIKTQPTDQVDCKGNKVTFSVSTGEGIGTHHYNWQRKRPGENSFYYFAAADSSKLPVPNIGVGNVSPNGTSYRVVVTDDLSTVTSEASLLTINEIKGIEPLNIANITACENESIWFKVSTSGTYPFGYQWIKKYTTNDWRDLQDNSTIKGSLTDSLQINNILLQDSGTYKVRVTFPTINGNHCVETSTITRRIIVNAVRPGVIEGSQSICPGLIADTIRSVQDGSGLAAATLAYQWNYSQDNGLTWKNSVGGQQRFNLPGILNASTLFQRFTKSTINSKLCLSMPSNSILIKPVDLIAPQIICANDTSVSTNFGDVRTGLTLMLPKTNDNCGISQVTNDAPEEFNFGETNVKWTVTDRSQNSTSCVQKVVVFDNEPPLFINLSNETRTFCPDDIEQAFWKQDDLQPVSIENSRFTLPEKDGSFNIPSSRFYDNVSDAADLKLIWGIYRNSPPYLPLRDQADNLLDNIEGQLSSYPFAINFESYQSAKSFFKISFWLKDAAGNLTPINQRHTIEIVLTNRPVISSNF